MNWFWVEHNYDPLDVGDALTEEDLWEHSHEIDYIVIINRRNGMEDTQIRTLEARNGSEHG